MWSNGTLFVTKYDKCTSTAIITKVNNSNKHIVSVTKLTKHKLFVV